MSGRQPFWLKCDACNMNLKIEVNREMQLAVRFKPSLVHLGFGRLKPSARLCRCESCGWVNVFVPSASVAAEQQNSTLTASWRNVTMKSS